MKVKHTLCPGKLGPCPKACVETSVCPLFNHIFPFHRSELVPFHRPKGKCPSEAYIPHLLNHILDIRKLKIPSLNEVIDKVYFLEQQSHQILFKGSPWPYKFRKHCSLYLLSQNVNHIL